MKEFKLIYGSFTSEEACEVLLGLLDYKIKFHSQKVFSNDIRFGANDIKSKKRIEELEKVKKELKEYFDKNYDKDSIVRVNSSVIINPFLEIGDNIIS